MAASALFEPLRFFGIRLAEINGAENYLEPLSTQPDHLVFASASTAMSMGLQR